jgi:hypothetical protein
LKTSFEVGADSARVSSGRFLPPCAKSRHGVTLFNHVVGKPKYFAGA